VAVGNSVTGSAQALEIILNGEKGPDWRRCDVLLFTWKPTHLLVGLPLSLDGTEQHMSQAARNFANQLAQRYKLPVDLVDERYTSIAASQRFAEYRASGQARRKDASKLDAIAACVMIESWLARAEHEQQTDSPVRNNPMEGAS